MFNDNEEDLMDRQEFVDIICDILKTNDGNFNAFAIDGRWGAGKTFVLKMLEDKLKEDYLIITFNAWESDFYEEPLIAILTCILEILNKKNMPKNWFEKLGETNTYLCKSINEEVLENIEPFKTIVKLVKKIIKKYKNPIMENTFDKNLNLKKVIRTLRDELLKLSNNVKILFVIDELDRCLPEYALKVMERVHHLFQNLKCVTTLYLIDKTQLSGMIRQYYGETFSEKEYFEKLFSFSIKLGIGLINEKLKEVIKIYSDYFEIDPEFNMDLTIQDILNLMLSHIPARQKLSLLEQVHLAHKLTLKGSNKKFDFSVALFEVFIASLLKFYNDYYNNLMNNKTFVHPANYGFIVNMANNQRLKKSLDELFAQKVKFIEKNLYYPNSIIVNSETFYRSILLSYLNKLICSECHIDLNSSIQEKSLLLGAFNFDKNCEFLQFFVKILKRLE